ncbi:MAG: heme-binding protein [Bdellovibrio sp.]
MFQKIEEPKYEVLKKEESFELRKYAPMILAQTEAQGRNTSEASNRGFRKIADYIFGSNIPKGSASHGEKIAMTAPVQAKAVRDGSQIAMTAPVQASGAGQGKWLISFVMPSSFSMETLPTPKNPEVQLISLPEKWMAVNSFSGFSGDEKVQEKTNALLEWISKSGWQVRGESVLSRYNPPWTLPFFRRNEVAFEVLR